jgi:multiple sugar transport system permease protein
MNNAKSFHVKFSPVMLTLPSIILLTVVVFIPAIQALGISFTDSIPGITPSVIGFKNYITIFKDPELPKLLLNNLFFIAGSLILEMTIGMGGALLLNRGFKLQPLWICLILSPYAISGVVSVIVWKFLLDPAYGMVNYLLSFLGVKPVLWFGSVLTSFIPVVITGVWKSVPFMIIILYAALLAIPVEISEAAKIDGVTRFRYFSRIVLPLVMPAFSVALMFRIIFLLRAFEQVWIFTAGGPGRSTEIFAITLYKEAFSFLNYGKASAFAWILLVITFVISLPIVKNTFKNSNYY